MCSPALLFIGVKITSFYITDPHNRQRETANKREISVTRKARLLLPYLDYKVLKLILPAVTFMMELQFIECDYACKSVRFKMNYDENSFKFIRVARFLNIFYLFILCSHAIYQHNMFSCSYSL